MQRGLGGSSELHDAVDGDPSFGLPYMFVGWRDRHPEADRDEADKWNNRYRK